MDLLHGAVVRTTEMILAHGQCSLQVFPTEHNTLTKSARRVLLCRHLGPRGFRSHAQGHTDSMLLVSYDNMEENDIFPNPGKELRRPDSQAGDDHGC